MQRKHNYSKRKIGPIYHLGRIFCMLLVLVLVNLLCRLLLFFPFSLAITFSYLLLFWYLPCAFFFGVKKYLFLCIRCSTLTLGRTRGRGGGGCHLPANFLSFLLEDKTSAPDVFSSCLLIPRAPFESSSVMFSFYGYEI